MTSFTSDSSDEEERYVWGSLRVLATADHETDPSKVYVMLAPTCVDRASLNKTRCGIPINKTGNAALWNSQHADEYDPGIMEEFFKSVYQAADILLQRLYYEPYFHVETGEMKVLHDGYPVSPATLAKQFPPWCSEPPSADDRD
jgi:hypothetical protein